MLKNKKKVVFLTGTRADFGKLKSLINILTQHPDFDVHIFATGMHLLEKYGATVDEIRKCGYKNIHIFDNSTSEKSMDLTLAKTIEGFSKLINDLKPDLLVVHGDRVEALAGAITGALNNILVAHVEGGEVSGTIDELIRHSVSKMSHLHFVANEEAKARLLQMGESRESVFIIGSPDIDIMLSESLPSIEETLQHYEIPFDEYAIVMFHPVTTEYEEIQYQVENLVKSILQSGKNYVVIYPNNDLGSAKILDEYKKFNGNSNIRVYPSIRFEYFLVLLQNAKFIIGNSSAGIREAPYYNIPVINIGTRQNRRSSNKNIFNVDYDYSSLNNALDNIYQHPKKQESTHFGKGKSDSLFLEVLLKNNIWKYSSQKTFVDLH